MRSTRTPRGVLEVHALRLARHDRAFEEAMALGNMQAARAALQMLVGELRETLYAAHREPSFEARARLRQALTPAVNEVIEAAARLNDGTDDDPLLRCANSLLQLVRPLPRWAA